MDRIGAVAIGIEGDYSNLEKDFARAIDVAVEKTKKLINSIEDVSRSFRDFGATMQRAGTSLTTAITLPLLGLGVAAIKTAGDLEQTTVAFKTLLGSEMAAQQHLTELRDFALKTPFQFTELIQASKRMQALGFAAKEVIPNLRTIGDAAAGLGLGAEGLNRITLALGQIKAKGAVQAEEMRQLAEAGIPAWQFLAKTLNTDVAGAMKAVEARTVEAAVAIPAILAGMNSKFGGLMQAQSETFLGALSNLKDAINFTLTDIGKTLLPTAKHILTDMLQPMLEKVKDLAAAFAALPAPMQQGIIAIAGFTAVAGPALYAIGGISNGIGALLPLLGQLPLLMNPVVLGIAAIGAASLIAFSQLHDATAQLHSLDAKFGEWLSKEVSNSDKFEDVREKLNRALEGGAIGLSSYNQMLQVLEDREKKAFGKEITDSLGKMGVHIKVLSDEASRLPPEVSAIINEQAKLTKEVEKAQQAYDLLNNAFRTGTALSDGHKVSQIEVGRALEALNDATKAAALQVEKHTKATQQHMHVQREMSLVYKLIADELAIQLASYHAVIQEVAKYNAALDIFDGTVKRLTVLEFLNRQLTEAKDAFEKLPEPMQSLDPILKATAEDMAKLGDATQAAAQKALDTSPYGKLEAALKSLGITSVAEYNRLAAEAEKAYEVVANTAGVAYADVERASLKAMLAQIEASYMVGETTKLQYDDMVAYIKGKLKELDANSEASAKTRRGHERALADDIARMTAKAFDGIARGLAHNIVEWKGWKETITSLLKTLAEDAIEIALKAAIRITGIQKAIDGALSGGSDVAKGAGGAASSAGGAGSAAGGASSLAGTVTAIASVGQLISSIVGNFQMAKMETTLNAIEESTRYLKIGLVTQGDSALNDLHMIRNTMTDLMKWNWDIATTYFQAISVNLDKIVSMGGFGTKGGSSNIAQAVGGYAVHIDLSGANLSGELTDSQVTRAFDRGFRMSKFGGALRPGVFPQ